MVFFVGFSRAQKGDEIMAKKRVLEPTKYPGIRYDREKDVYLVSLDFGRVTKVDPKTGKLVERQKKTNKTCYSLAEARALKDEHDAAKRKGLLAGENSKITFDEACEDYFRNRMQKVRGKSWSPAYLERQQIHRNRVHDYLIVRKAQKKPIREFSIRDVEDLFDWCSEEHTIEIPQRQPDGKYKMAEKKYEALGYRTIDKLKSFLKGLNQFVMKDFGKYGVSRDIISSAEISVKKKTFTPTVLDAEQVNYLIRYALDFEMRDHMGAPLVNVVLGCLCGGMRRGEQLGVKWSDLQLPSDGENDGRVHICRQRVQSKAGAYEKTPKGGDDEGETPEERKERWAPLPRSAWTLLQLVREEQSRYREITDNDYIYLEPDCLNGDYLPNPKHTNRRFNEFQKRCNAVREKAGLDPIPHVRLHDLRHTFAGLLQHFDGSKYPEIGWIEHDLISYAMGHRTKGTTVTEKVYLHDNGVRTRMNKALDLCITTPLERHDYQNM